MNWIKRMIAYTLLVLTVLPINFLAMAQAADQSGSNAFIAKTINEKISMPSMSTQPIELMNERTKYSNTYVKPDGTKIKTISKDPINFESSANGKTSWQAIDNNLEASANTKDGKSKIYSNKANSFQISIGENLSEDGIKANKNGSVLSFKYPGASNLVPEKQENKLLYKNVSEDTDIEYESLAYGLKETIIINRSTDQNVFSFDLALGDMSFEKQSTGGYMFYNPKNEPVYYMPAPFMMDAKEVKDQPESNISYDVQSEIVKAHGGLRLNLTLDQNWLKDPTRVFPIKIDPSLYVDLDYGEDSYIQEGSANTASWDQMRLYTGKTKLYISNQWYYKYRTRTLIPFAIDDLSHARIQKATFKAYQTYCDSGSNVSAYLTGDYDFKTVTWNTQPWRSSQSVGSISDTGSNKWVEMDVTAAAKYWFEDGNVDGTKVGSFEFIQDDESAWGYHGWWAENSTNYGPELTIEYNDYDAAYSLGSAPVNPQILSQVTFPIKVTNVGRSYWDASATKIGWKLRNNTTGDYKEGTSDLPSSLGYNQNVQVDVPIKLFDSIGNYTITWDMIQPGVTWFSSQGVATASQSFNVIDFPEYAVEYSVDPIPAMAAGSTSIIPVHLTNRSRYDWSPDLYNIGYHWINKTTREMIMWDGPAQALTQTIPKREGFGTVLMNIKMLQATGDFILQIDLLRGYNWFSVNNALPLEISVRSDAPAFSSLNHFGDDPSYAKTGPVDLASGQLSFTTTDLTVNSNTKGLSVSRTYNSFTPKDYYLDSNGYIKNWLFNGLYFSADDNSRLSTPFIDEAMSPSQGIISSEKNWYRSESSWPSSYLNLTSQLDYDGVFNKQAGPSNSVLYGHVYVYSPANRSVLLKIGSEDSVRAWLNGNNILSRDLERPFVPDGDSVATTLQSGWNRLMVKFSLRGDKYWWDASVRITDADGSTAYGLRYALDNPNAFQNDRLLGRGWAVNFDEYLGKIDSKNFYYRDSTGAISIFYKNADGSYAVPAGKSLTLNVGSNSYIEAKNGVKTYFRSDGKISEKDDLSGNKIAYVYDTSGKLISLKDGNRYIVMSYDGEQLKSVADQADNIVSYELWPQFYSSYKKLSILTDPLGNKVSFDYGPVLKDPPVSPLLMLNATCPDYAGYGSLRSFTNKRGFKTSFSYVSGKVQTVTDALGSKTTFNYLSGSTEITDALGRKSTAEFNNSNTLTSFTDASGQKELYQSDSNQNVTSITPAIDQNSDYFFKWNYAYDNNSNTLSETDPINRSMNYTYANNDLTRIDDPAQNSNQFTYSADGRRLLTTEKDGRGYVTSYSYDANGRTTAITDPKGATSRYTYSADGDQLTDTTAKSEKTTLIYDSLGRMVTNTSPMGSASTIAYDQTGRITSVTDAAGAKIQSGFDQNGNIIKTIDPQGKIKKYEYDPLDRVTKVTDELGFGTSFAYDAVGNRVRSTDSKGKTTQYFYNAVNQLIKLVDPAGQLTTYQYDINNQLTKIIKPDGNQVSLTLDKAGQVTSVQNNESNTSYTYDQNGNVKSINSNSNGERNSLYYDKNSNLVGATSSVAGTTNISYDQNSNPGIVKVPTASIQYAYDANEQTSKVSATIAQTGQTIANQMIRDGDGKLTQIIKANKDTTNFIYDASGRIINIVTKNLNGVVFESFAYQYDLSSNVTKITNKYNASKIYNYDARGQLLKENASTYTYDAMGNRTKYVNGIETVNYYYDEAGDANRLISLTSTKNGTSTYSYDNNGNIVGKIAADGKTTYFYDSDDYFIKAIVPSGITVEYTYDKLAKRRLTRTEKNPSGIVTSFTKFTYDGDKLVSETDSSGKISRFYTWDENENLLSITLPSPNGSLVTYYYVKNAKGDVVGLTMANGWRAAVYEYDAWGNITRTAVTLTNVPTDLDKQNPRLYSGYWYDHALGMYFMGARLYDPSTGRFTSKDPQSTGLDSLDQNPYLYCNNNPINKIDPTGKFLFLAPLIAYAIAAVPAILISLNMLVNTPALQASIADDIGRASDASAKNSQRIMAGLSVAASVVLVGAGGKSGSKAIGAVAKERIIQNAAKGRVGEEAAKQLGLIDGIKKSIDITLNKIRIPDYINEASKEIREVKNVQYLTYTKQLRDFIEYSRANGYTFKLIVNKSTTISSVLEEIVGKANIIRIPMP